MQPEAVSNKVYSRIGLLGNPSDGFQGKTISLSCANFWAEVKLKPANKVTFIPHPQHDLLEYDDLTCFTSQVSQQGYYGGIRLLMAMCKRFAQYCKQHSIQLSPRNFSLGYDTNIPRQAGLSGSSAIACAALNCLMQYFNVQDRIAVAERPELILSAEAELGITAGLQDRVIQVYGGLMFMDFSNLACNRYERLDAACLPPLWLMYSNSPSDSGAVHSPVKQRWLAGDADIRRDMKLVADIAQSGREALEAGNHAKLAELMNKNFDLRRSMFGDAALGATNLSMIHLARSVGAAAKFTGSGGAAVVYCPQGNQQAQQLQSLCQQESFVMVAVVVGPAHCSDTT